MDAHFAQVRRHHGHQGTRAFRGRVEQGPPRNEDEHQEHLPSAFAGRRVREDCAHQPPRSDALHRARRLVRGLQERLLDREQDKRILQLDDCARQGHGTRRREGPERVPEQVGFQSQAQERVRARRHLLCPRRQEEVLRQQGFPPGPRLLRPEGGAGVGGRYPHVGRVREGAGAGKARHLLHHAVHGLQDLHAHGLVPAPRRPGH